MRNEIIKYIKSLGGSAFYSGRMRMLFCDEQYHDRVIEKFGMWIGFNLSVDFNMNKKRLRKIR